MATRLIAGLFKSTYTAENHEIYRLWRATGFVVVLLAALWTSFYVIDKTFPFVHAGSDIIYKKKYDLIVQEKLYPEQYPAKIAMFGNSKTLAGLIPELLDKKLGVDSYTYNFGLPNVGKFVEELEKLVEKGDIPTHLLLQVPWDNLGEESLLHYFESDKTIINALVPFRNLPRDFTIFVFFAAKNGGLIDYYRQKKSLVEQMVKDRGYHFISGQSHFANHRLPDDFSLEIDQPDNQLKRILYMNAPLFARLNKLVEAHNMKVYFVPEYYREGEVAPVLDINAENKAKLREFDSYKILGPDYILLENKYFSDPVHLNPEGAVVYTHYLAALLGKELKIAESGN